MMKKLWSVVLCLLLVCGAAAGEGLSARPDDATIVDEIVNGITQMAAIPRPSRHEERISAFFMDRARAQGFEPRQDAALNVMFDAPATPVMLEFYGDRMC